MSASLAIAIALFLGFIGAVLLCIGVVGRMATGLPLCARCRADVRSAAWDDAPRCPACSADLARGGSVRLAGRRRRTPELLAGLVLAALALSIWRMDASLARRQLTWHELQPLWLELRRLRDPSRPAEPTLESIRRRWQAGWLSLDQERSIVETLAARRPITEMTRRVMFECGSDPALRELWPLVVQGATLGVTPYIAPPLGTTITGGDRLTWRVSYNSPTPKVAAHVVVERVAIGERAIEFTRKLNGNIEWSVPDDIPEGFHALTFDTRVVAAPDDLAALASEEIVRLPSNGASSLGFPCEIQRASITYNVRIMPKLEAR